VLGVAHHLRAVNVVGDLPPEGLVEQVVLRRGAQILVAPDHVGDLHEVVVHDVGEVVRGHPVGLEEHLVVEGCVLDGDRAEDLVLEGRRAHGGDALPHHVGNARVEFPPDLLFRELLAVAVVAEGQLSQLQARAQLLEALLVAEAVVGHALLDQLLGVLLVDGLALVLDVGAVGPALVGALVPDEPRLLQGPVDQLHGALDDALLVGVLDAEDEVPVVLLRPEVGVKRRPEVAHVHVARGAGCESRPDSHGVPRLGPLVVPCGRPKKTGCRSVSGIPCVQSSAGKASAGGRKCPTPWNRIEYPAGPVNRNLP